MTRDKARGCGCLGGIYCILALLYGIVFWGRPVTVIDYAAVALVILTFLGCVLMVIFPE